MKDTITTNESEVTRADALLLFKLINDEAVSEDARHHLTAYVDEVLNAAPITDATNNRPLFLRGFVEGWQQVNKYARRNVGEILQRVKGGESVESVIGDFQRQMTAVSTKAIRERAQAIIADQRYDVDTRDAILGSLQDDSPNLAEFVRRAERSEMILDLTAVTTDAPPHTLAELAAHISAVLNHPLTPPSIRNDLADAVNDLDTPQSFYNSAIYIEGRLSGLAELPQEGGAH